MYSQLTPGFNNWSYKTHPYATHQPFLYEALVRTNSNVIEFGCGHFSTGLIHSLLGSDRQCISVDDDATWLMKFQNFANHQHKFLLANDIDRIREIVESLDNISVMLVDNNDWMLRYQTLKLFNEVPEVVVIHDSERYPKWGLIKDFTKYFKYRANFKAIWTGQCCGPETLLASNKIDVTTWQISNEFYL